MICIISGKKTNMKRQNLPIHRETVDFVEWHIRLLNIEQRAKGTYLITWKEMVKMYIKLSQKYNWQTIKEKMADELLLKGLIQDDEHISKTKI